MVIKFRWLHVQLHVFHQICALVPSIALVELVLVLDELEAGLPSAKIVVAVVVFVLLFLYYISKTFNEALVVVAHLMSRNRRHRPRVLHGQDSQRVVEVVARPEVCGPASAVTEVTVVLQGVLPHQRGLR